MSLDVAGWGGTAWGAAGRRWSERELERLGRRVLGPWLDVSIQPWSAVWRVHTDRGNVVVKQTTPVRAWEGAAQAFCADIAPDQVDRPLAFDEVTGCLLLRDRGPTMFEAEPDSRGIEVATVSAMVADYARMQQYAIGRARDARTAGIVSWDPANAATVAKRQARQLHDLPSTDPRHITHSQQDQIVDHLPTIHATAMALANSPVPWCIEHGDLWPGNVVPPQEAHPGYRFIDFGDIAWSHPFLSLIMLVIECRHRWSTPDLPDRLNIDDPNLNDVFDAYLDCWRHYASPGELRQTLCHALQLASLRRSQAWITNLHQADEVDLQRYGRLPWAWLEDVTRPVGP